MIDGFDYKEPRCNLCGGKEFYNPKLDTPSEIIPVQRIIEKADRFYERNQLEDAESLLNYWKNEAYGVRDRKGELALLNELLGVYRKLNNKEKCLKTIDRSLELINTLYKDINVSTATIMLNVATAYKSLKMSEKAVEIYRQVENIYQQKLDVSDLKFAGLYNNLALALVDEKQYKGAEEYYLKALEILKEKEGQNNDMAITYVNMAHLYEDMYDNNKKVVECLYNAYGLLTEEKVEKDGYYAYVCGNCAPSFRYFGFEIIAKELESISEKTYERIRNS